LKSQDIRTARYQVKFFADIGEIHMTGTSEIGLKHLREDKPGVMTAGSSDPFTVEVRLASGAVLSKHEGKASHPDAERHEQNVNEASEAKGEPL
jgi:hypothetical protein